ncbi:TetR/AcrR family transcriptional regulator [Marinobacter zhejiangensis]|uniref:Transcriptional regulator, TetR family n=1 Tax=Marinobacter zhejiangensis TaxID=488535 RepID=A0A1I4KSD6_9GAMM|nr:TetR/AcrR family transcriptional regulator [Marinobacter zhejiangensis]SFL81704.1 transcriptional regulator, TetR family [Marinobacter zhejiangensis]
MTDQLKTRREREKQARYEAILDAAEGVFSEKGYERTSMDDIARRASLSRALLYVYFKDKAAIQHGITLRAAANLRERMEKAAAGADTGLAQAAAIGQAYYEFYREEPEYFSALTQANAAPVTPDEEQAARMRCSESAIMELMIETIKRGLADGSLNSERIRDPMETALYLRGALHGVIMGCGREIDGAFARFPSEALIEHTLAMLMSSIAGKSTP